MIQGHESIEESSGTAGEKDERELDALLDFLRHHCGFDVTGHKRPSLVRRLRRRLSDVGISSFARYRDYLELHEDELTRLCDVLLINVTAFFRDPPAWRALAELLPSMVDPDPDAPIRVWSAGCSSGEEPYTLAMVLGEVLGEDACARRVKIYATDIDEAALARARLATYPSEALEAVPPDLAEKYFSRCAAGFVFKSELRRGIIFGRHDLVQDAPIPRIDVLVCRNALMYFNAETQERILQRLQFSVNPRGVLFLGRAEMLLSHTKLFVPIDLESRLFSPVTKTTRRRQKSAPDADDRDVSNVEDGAWTMRQLAFAISPVAQMVIDVSGRLATANHRALNLLSLSPSDFGRPFEELMCSQWSELSRSIEEARVERRSREIKELECVLSTGEQTFLDIELTPLRSEGGAVFGVHVGLVDVTQARRLRTELRRAKIEIEAAHEDLRAARLEIRSTHEALQATNDELETTSEELEATNEQLEATNEELQATNQELQTINEELRQRGTELTDTTALFGAVLASFKEGVAVLDRELCARAWNSKMVEILGVRPHDFAGKPLADLAMGTAMHDIAASLRAALETGEESERTIDSTRPQGKNVACTVRVSPLRGERIRGVLVLVEEVG